MDGRGSGNKAARIELYSNIKEITQSGTQYKSLIWIQQTKKSCMRRARWVLLLTRRIKVAQTLPTKIFARLQSYVVFYGGDLIVATETSQATIMRGVHDIIWRPIIRIH
jgi:hypothetical protein